MTQDDKTSPNPTVTKPATSRPASQPPPTPEERRQILHLHEQGYGTREIALRVLRNRKLVQRILREEGHDPARSTRASSASKLDPFREAIQERVEKHITTTRILREIRALGYNGGRTILAEYAGSLQGPFAPRKPVKRRFETRVGEEMQVDWSVYTVPIAGQPERIHALGCVLCHSRYIHVRFYRDEREATLLEALAHAFEEFCGVGQRVVFDNMATVVLGRIGPNRKPVWHPRFIDFARYYGFKPFLCKVRDPDRKGKTERVFDFLEKDFVRGSSFASFEDLNERAKVWCDEVANRRVHGTTGLVPAEAWLAERDFLIRLPDVRFAVHQDSVRGIEDDSTLSIGGRRYTVPATLGRGPVAVRLYALHFEVLDRGGAVAFSRRYAEPSDPARLHLDPTHYATLPRSLPGPAGRRLDEQFVERFPGLAGLVEGIERRMKSLAHIHLRALWRLAETYGEQAFLHAALRAQQYRRHDSQGVQRLLEREHPLRQSTPPVLPVGDAARVRALLGEVDPGSLDSYRHLDTVPAAAGDEPPAPAPALDTSLADNETDDEA
jgi:transposase